MRARRRIADTKFVRQSDWWNCGSGSQHHSLQLCARRFYRRDVRIKQRGAWEFHGTDFNGTAIKANFGSGVPSNWDNVGNEVIASGAITSVQDTNHIGSAPRYYRVRLVASSIVPPSLFASRSGHQLFLSWPSLGTAGFTLESATSLTPVTVWNSVTNPVSDNGVIKSVTVDQITTPPQRLFRLRQ